MEIQIDSLVNHPDKIGIVSEWCYREWGYLTPTIGADHYAHSLQAWITDNTLLLLIALDDAIPVGSIGLIHLEQLSGVIPGDLGPWVAFLYVIPGYRNRLIGVKLIRSLYNRARRDGYQSLFSFIVNEKLRELSYQYGWRDVDLTERMEFPFVVQKIDL